LIGDTDLISFLDFPFLVLLSSLLILWLTVLLGEFVAGRLRPVPEDGRDDLNLVTSASLTLLALIIGFSFSMALSRFDQRKNYEEEEANAIGTEYVRADLLPAADAARVKNLLTQYLDQRLLFYTTRDSDRLATVASETTRLQNEMWSIVQDAAHTQPTPPMVTVVFGMNDVLNRQGYSQAAWWYRIPIGAWAMMIVLAVCCCLLVGYGARRRGFLLAIVMPFLVSISFFFIADIDSPRRGVIRVVPQNLTSLSQSLHPH
jgi:hypothetical protein